MHEPYTNHRQTHFWVAVPDLLAHTVFPNMFPNILPDIVLNMFFVNDVKVAYIASHNEAEV